MNITLNPKAKYVTQSGIYDCPMLDVLTDRRIAHYEEQGFYGEEAKQKRLEERKQRKLKQQKHKFRLRILPEFQA